MGEATIDTMRYYYDGRPVSLLDSSPRDIKRAVGVEVPFVRCTIVGVSVMNLFGEIDWDSENDRLGYRHRVRGGQATV